MKRIVRAFIFCLFAFCLAGCSNEVSDETEPSGNTPGIEDRMSDRENMGPVSILEYGAVGDGITDDAKAIQEAIDSGEILFFPKGEYYIGSPIVMTDKKYWSFNAWDAVFIYEGSDYAFKVLDAENCRLEIGRIKAPDGGGIQFYGESPSKWNQYITLLFNSIDCKTNCIYVKVTGGWSNENRIYGGRFAGGENGVRIDYEAGDILNGWKFYDCGIEGVTNGFYINSVKGVVSDLAIVNARYAESFECVLKTEGIVQNCLWIGTGTISEDIISCSPQTERFEIQAPVGEQGHRGCIVGGKLLIEITDYKSD